MSEEIKEVDAYKIFRQLEKRKKRANPYTFYDKDELIDEIKKIKGKKVSICNAIIFCYKNNLVDMARLKKQILNFSNSINGIVDMESALQELERIYNYGIKKKENIVYISTEWKKRR